MKDKKEILQDYERDYRQAWCTTIQIVLQLLILFFVFLIFISTLAGCTIVEYGEARYTSFGGKEFETLKITKEKDGGISLEINNYRREGISDVVEGVVRGTLKAVRP